MLENGGAREESSTAVLEHVFRGLDLFSAPASVGIAVVMLVQTRQVNRLLGRTACSPGAQSKECTPRQRRQDQ